MPGSELGPCKVCGKAVSVRAASCPHCGEPDPYKAPRAGCLASAFGLAVISAVFILFLWLVGVLR